MSKFTDQLSAYIEKAFDNEDEFIKKFYRHGGESPELLGCYMASESTNISVLLWSGETITDVINTEEFIEWCDKIGS